MPVYSTPHNTYFSSLTYGSVIRVIVFFLGSGNWVRMLRCYSPLFDVGEFGEFSCSKWWSKPPPDLNRKVSLLNLANVDNFFCCGDRAQDAV